MVGTERKNFENFASLNRRKWHFQSLLLGPFIDSFIMICESMLSASQDGDYYEKCCYQNIDYRYLIIYIYIYDLKYF